MTADRLPPHSCDTHLHFYDNRYPSAATTVLRPPDAGPDRYRELQGALGLDRLVVVQPTTYGLDNTCQLDAMAAFGDRARGVMVVDRSTPTAELHRLTELGVRGARFHMLPGGAVGWDHLEPVADKIAEFGWHIQLQLNGRELPMHAERVAALPVDVVIDHVGRFTPPVAPTDASFRCLLGLLDSGSTWVKLSAPYESEGSVPPDYADVGLLVCALLERHVDRLLWASNWPHPGQSDPPSHDQLSRLLLSWLPEPTDRTSVLVDNPARLYDF